MSKESAKLSSALENYLEIIAFIQKEKKVVRVVDIANYLGVKSPSVNIAIKLLAENGFVEHEKYRCVELTPKGEKIAHEVQEKHDALFSFLNQLLFVENFVAKEEACAIEHVVSDETISRLKNLFLYLKNSVFTNKKKLTEFRDFLLNNKVRD